LLISETIVVRPFLHKHAEHAEYHRSPVLNKHQEKFSGWCIGRAADNLRDGFEYFEKYFLGVYG
jgi:hypothetical protein